MYLFYLTYLFKEMEVLNVNNTVEKKKELKKNNQFEIEIEKTKYKLKVQYTKYDLG